MSFGQPVVPSFAFVNMLAYLLPQEIPLAARVFAVADTLDALTTDRPYRPAAGWKEAREEIRRYSGRQFDPTVVAAYDAIPDDEFERLREGAQ